MMAPSYVDSDDFRVSSEARLGCMGRRLLVREYRLRANPDQRPGNDMTATIAAKWAQADCPVDAVFHLGDFYRVTVEGAVG